MLVNQNLMNPEIVTRTAEMRERDLRSQICGLNGIAGEREVEGVRVSEQRGRAPRRRLTTALAWVSTLLAR